MTGFGKLQFVSARVKVRHSRRVLRLAGIDRETDAWKANAGRSAQRDRIPLGFTAPTSPATPFTPHGVVEGAYRVQPRGSKGGSRSAQHNAFEDRTLCRNLAAGGNDRQQRQLTATLPAGRHRLRPRSRRQGPPTAASPPTKRRG